MSVICLTSLKGGVGKTSLSINLAHALALGDCQVLLIDFDPAAHASRFLNLKANSKLAELFLQPGLREEESVLDVAISSALNLVVPVRKNLDVIPAGPELRHFFWGQGARLFKDLFSRFVEELGDVYDHIIIDTAPDFNILTRNAIASSQVCLVPVDSSQMSIFGLEEIVSSAAHIKGPTWSVVRSMVSRQASRIQKLSEDKLEAQFDLKKDFSSSDDDDEEFFELVESFEEKRTEQAASDAPIFLFQSKIFRSEQINRLSFSGKTAFDTKQTENIARQYKLLASELESLIEMSESLEPELTLEGFSAMGMANRGSARGGVGSREASRGREEKVLAA